MKQITIDWQGQKITAWYHKTPDRVWLHVGGETYFYEPEVTSRRKRGGAAAVASGPDILAPMPGKITKISIHANDLVLAGQVLVVMEAMKMEYTLKAKVSGQITEVCCQVGDQVSLGQMLVRIRQGE